MYIDSFTHNGSLFDLTKIRNMVRHNTAFLLPYKDLAWILKYDKPDEDRVLKAKHRYPLLVTKWNDKWTVIDGLHRLERYRRKGIITIPVKYVDSNVLEKARISNSKI